MINSPWLPHFPRTNRLGQAAGSWPEAEMSDGMLTDFYPASFQVSPFNPPALDRSL